MLLQMALFHSFFLWLGNIPLCVCMYVYVYIYIYIYICLLYSSVDGNLDFFCVSAAEIVLL